MTYEFVEAEPVAVVGGGRKAEPNPFTEVIASIALKTNEQTGKPVARSFIETHEAGQSKPAVEKIKRLTSKAGEQNDPPVTVRVHGTPVLKGPKGRQTEDDTRTTITFWTVTRQERPKKNAVNGARSATTEQAVAVAQPSDAPSE